MTGTAGSMTATTTTTTSAPPRLRPRPRFGAVVAFGLMLAACSAAEPAAAPSTTLTARPSVTRPAASETRPLLAEALERYEAGYEFASRVIVNGEDAVSVNGRTIDGAFEMTIRSGEGEIEYLAVGSDRWARSPDGAWDAVVEDGTTSLPLGSFRAPTSVAVRSENGQVVVLEATYPAEAFMQSGSDLVVTLTIDGGRLASARYSSHREGLLATVQTDFRDLSDTTAITAPIA